VALLASFFQNDDTIDTFSEDLLNYLSPRTQEGGPEQEADTPNQRPTSPLQGADPTLSGMPTAEPTSQTAHLSQNSPLVPHDIEVDDDSPEQLAPLPVPSEWEEGSFLNLIIKDFNIYDLKDEETTSPAAGEDTVNSPSRPNKTDCPKPQIVIADMTVVLPQTDTLAAPPVHQPSSSQQGPTLTLQQSPTAPPDHQPSPSQQNPRLIPQPSEATKKPDLLKVEYSHALKALKALMDTSSDTFDNNFRTTEILRTIERIFYHYSGDKVATEGQVSESTTASDADFIQAASAWEKREFGRALECYIRALYGYRMAGIHLMIAATYGGISLIYSHGFGGDPNRVLGSLSKTEHHTRALETIAKAWEVYRAGSIAQDLARLFSLGGIPKAFLGRFEKPFESYELLFANCEESLQVNTYAYLEVLNEVAEGPDRHNDGKWKLFYVLSGGYIENPKMLMMFVHLAKLHGSLGIGRQLLQDLWTGLRGMVLKYGSYFRKALLLIVLTAYCWRVFPDIDTSRESYNRELVGWAKLKTVTDNPGEDIVFV